MILLNFAHQLTSDQCAQIEALTGEKIEKIYNLAVHFDNAAPFLPQLDALMKQIPLSPEEWQTASVLVNPPSLNFITALLLAELHGRMGYFPPIVRLRPLNTVPPRYEVAEVINLNAVREAARARRYTPPVSAA